MKQILLFSLALAFSFNYLNAKNNLNAIPADSSRVIDIEEVVVVASPKESRQLRKSSTSVSLFSKETMQSIGVRKLNNISGYAPNFFMPEYGSAQTSAIYIRGVGSRINTPAVALYVDNMPVTDKSGYSSHMLGLNRVDVLRGPQGTLYGRNAMGGVVRIYTDDPFINKGVTVQTGTSTRDGRYYLNGLLNQKISDKLALSVGGFYDTNKGIYHNDSLGKRTGGDNQIGGKVRFCYRPNENWKFDLNTNYEYIDQDAYPYFYGGAVSGTETLPQILNSITANHEGKYRRNLFNAGFLTQYKAPLFTASSITSFQHLGDRTLMDQDFTYQDIYTLEQRQKSNSITEEIVLKSLPGKRWEWTGGLFGIWQNLHTKAPVTFFSGGVDMVNGNIARYMPTPNVTVMNPATGQPVTQQMAMNLTITDNYFRVPTNFRSPILGGAGFFQGTLHDLLINGLGLTLGLRLDYEHQQLTYAAGTPVNYLFQIPSHKIKTEAATTTTLNGKLQNDYTNLLPKFALQYDFNDNRGNVYASVSKGLRSGGYNIQMFSDVMSNVMQNDMMIGVRDYCYGVLTQHAQNMPAMANMFNSIRDAIVNNIPVSELPDIKNIVTYKPEYNWNYEVGTHLNFLDRTLLADVSFFFIDTKDQQISRFVSSGLGRIMVNAGNSHSCGLEAALHGNFLDNRLGIHLNYGYTHAIFNDYNAGTGADYTDNKVPFIPEHNIGLAVDYTQPINNSFLKAITIGANTNGFGRIYWTESNDSYQNFYATLGSHILLDFDHIKLNLWGKNLTQTHYKAFSFESMNKNYYQKGLPLQLGFDLSFTF